MESFSNNSLLPEQIWDTADIPGKGLFFGKHSGSAMPLTWAHAEYIKLCSSIKKRKICDLPMYTQERYINNKIKSSIVIWRFNQQEKIISCKKLLRIEVLAEAVVRWTDNNWTRWKELPRKIHALEFMLQIFRAVPPKEKTIALPFFGNKPIIGRIKILK